MKDRIDILFILLIIIGLIICSAGTIWNQYLVYEKTGVVFTEAWIPHWQSIVMQVSGFIILGIGIWGKITR